jgi:Peptidase M50B-like
VADWQKISVAGEPVAYGIGYLVLGVVAFVSDVAASIVRVAHEGGHMMAALITGHRVTGFELEEGDAETGSGVTYFNDGPFGWLGEVFNSFAGYATPPLVGLGGAYVIASGNSWGVLVAGVVLLLAVLLIPNINPYALASPACFSSPSSGPSLPGVRALTLVIHGAGS